MIASRHGKKTPQRFRVRHLRAHYQCLARDSLGRLARGSTGVIELDPERIRMVALFARMQHG